MTVWKRILIAFSMFSAIPLLPEPLHPLKLSARLTAIRPAGSNFFRFIYVFLSLSGYGS